MLRYTLTLIGALGHWFPSTRIAQRQQASPPPEEVRIEEVKVSLSSESAFCLF
jgi:hypothetical protein